MLPLNDIAHVKTVVCKILQLSFALMGQCLCYAKIRFLQKGDHRCRCWCRVVMLSFGNGFVQDVNDILEYYDKNIL